MCVFVNNHLNCAHPGSIFYSQSPHTDNHSHTVKVTPKHIGNFTARQCTVKRIYLSIAPPVCLSRNPFHHSVILLSVRLHSSVIIRQKNVTHTSSPQPIRLYTSLRSKPRGPPETHAHAPNSARTHLNYTIISFVVIFFSV